MVLAEDGFSTRGTVDTGHLPVKLKPIRPARIARR